VTGARAGGLELWLLPRGAATLRRHCAAGLPQLSKDERERVLRSRSAAAARRFLLGRVLLRHALGAHLGVDPARLVIVPDRGGKPRLLEPDCPGLGFSLTHSRSDWAVALAHADGLGADLEPLDRIRAIGAIAATFYSAAERQQMAGDPTAALQLWTLKEAVAKALGGTIWQGLREVSLALRAGRIEWLARPPAGEVACWSLLLGRLRGDHWLALALRSAAAHRQARRHVAIRIVGQQAAAPSGLLEPVFASEFPTLSSGTWS
jgi:4'-phosphopantetheinyl transferase